MKKNKSINDSDNYKIAFEKGKIEGKEERDIELINNMYYRGLTIENISLFTDFSENKIKQILNLID
jgi:predicted transposase YdaD